MVRTLSDQERERKRIERNAEKREKRARLKRFERWFSDNGENGFGAQLDQIVTQHLANRNGHIDRDAVRAIVDEHLKGLQPTKFIVELEGVAREIEGRAHRMFEPLLKLCW